MEKLFPGFHTLFRLALYSTKPLSRAKPLSAGRKKTGEKKTLFLY